MHHCIALTCSGTGADQHFFGAISPPPVQVKVWSMLENKPALLATENLNVGAVFGMSFCRQACGWGCPVMPACLPVGCAATHWMAACLARPTALALPLQALLWLHTLPNRPALIPPWPAHCCRDAPLILAAGGAKGSVSVWDTMSSAAVNSFVQRHAPEVAAAAGGGGEQQQQEGAA